jgi:hypothetical protein
MLILVVSLIRSVSHVHTKRHGTNAVSIALVANQFGVSWVPGRIRASRISARAGASRSELRT